MDESSGDGLEISGELTIPNDIKFNIDTCPVYDISFGGEHGEVGRLTFSDNQIHFTGKADESAKQFFDFLKQYVDGYIAEKLKNVEKAKELCRKYAKATEFWDELIQHDFVKMSLTAKRFVNHIGQEILDVLENGKEQARTDSQLPCGRG